MRTPVRRNAPLYGWLQGRGETAATRTGQDAIMAALATWGARVDMNLFPDGVLRITAVSRGGGESRTRVLYEGNIHADLGLSGTSGARGMRGPETERLPPITL